MKKLDLDPSSARPFYPYTFDVPVVSTELQRIVEEYRHAGLEICVVDRTGPPGIMGLMLGFQPEDCVVTSMMAGSPMDGYPQLRDAVYGYAYKLGRMGMEHPFLRMPLLNGGGDDSLVTGQPGLMGAHSLGVVESGAPLHFVITEDLIKKEGLRKGWGKGFCLLHAEGNTQLGLRTDMLNALSRIIVFWPGGFGTDTEAFIRLTNTSINPQKKNSYCLFVNMPDTDPVTGDKIGYFDLLFRHNMQGMLRGGVRQEALAALNEQVLVYNPPTGVSAQALGDDVVTILFALRAKGMETGCDLSKDQALGSFLCAWPKVLTPGASLTSPYPLFEDGKMVQSLRDTFHLAPPERPGGLVRLPGTQPSTSA